MSISHSIRENERELYAYYEHEICMFVITRYCPTSTSSKICSSFAKSIEIYEYVRRVLNMQLHCSWALFDMWYSCCTNRAAEILRVVLLIWYLGKYAVNGQNKNLTKSNTFSCVLNEKSVNTPWCIIHLFIFI